MLRQEPFPVGYRILFTKSNSFPGPSPLVGIEPVFFRRTRTTDRMIASYVRARHSSTGFHVVAIDQVLIAQIKFPVADDRVRPDPALGRADRGLRIELEAPVLLPAFRRRINQRHRSI